MATFIVFCPVCCSNSDIEAQDGQEVSHECMHCGQVFAFVVSHERFAAHSLA